MKEGNLSSASWANINQNISVRKFILFNFDLWKAFCARNRCEWSICCEKRWLSGKNESRKEFLSLTFLNNMFSARSLVIHVRIWALLSDASLFISCTSNSLLFPTNSSNKWYKYWRGKLFLFSRKFESWRKLISNMSEQTRQISNLLVSYFAFRHRHQNKFVLNRQLNSDDNISCSQRRENKHFS